MTQKPLDLAEKIISMANDYDVSTAATSIAIAYTSLCKSAGVREEDAVGFLRMIYNADDDETTAH